MYLHCLTHDPSTDPLTAQAAPKLIPRHREVFLAPTDLQNQQQALCWRRASEHLALLSKEAENEPARQYMPLKKQ